SDAVWLKMDFQQLYNVVTNTLKHLPGSTKSDVLKNLNYITIEPKDHSYHSLIKSYPAFGQILQAVELWMNNAHYFLFENIAEATIQFVYKKRNENSQGFNIHGINLCVFEQSGGQHTIIIVQLYMQKINKSC
ncbi:13491_t:CDS:2, partial [Rhizophagus irregularis]